MLQSIEAIDTTTGTTSVVTATLPQSKALGVAIPLQSGYSLISGGITTTWDPLDAEEVHKIPENLVVSTGKMVTPRFNHAAVALPNGGVLITGGMTLDGERVQSTLDSCEIFDMQASFTIRFTTNTMPLSKDASTPTTQQLTAKDAAGVSCTVTWSSSDTSVATIDASGLLTAKAPGTTIITATDEKGVQMKAPFRVIPQ